MAPLKCLERENPIIDSNFQKFCASRGIFSVEDFLIQDLYVLAAYAEQHPTSERLKEGITQVLTITDNQHQPWTNGMKLLEDAVHNKRFLSTGIDGVDVLLRGGLRQGQLTELVGPSSSGKTQFCLQTAANIAKKHVGTVIYLDTGNSFSPHRIAHFVGKTSAYAFDQAKILQKAMSNIVCHSVFDVFALFDVLSRLEADLRSQMASRSYQTCMLIIDSISSLITPVLGGRVSHGRSLMISTGYLLKKLADEHNLAVLVTNHTVGAERGTSKPALGESWKGITHVRLLLSRDHGSNICKVSILKHPSMACDTAATFSVQEL